jgi:hypothetical protein
MALYSDTFSLLRGCCLYHFLPATAFSVAARLIEPTHWSLEVFE